jgi:hypothetical protein
MSSEKTFKSSEIAPSLLVTVAPGDRVNAMVKFEFPNSLSQMKRAYVMDWTPKHDDVAATLEAAAAEIRRLRGEKS